LPDFNVAQNAFTQAQTELAKAQQLNQKIPNPTDFVSQNSLSTQNAYVPQATQAVLSNIINPQAVIENVLSSLPSSN
jgi:hypothetical protein